MTRPSAWMGGTAGPASWPGSENEKAALSAAFSFCLAETAA